MLSVQGIEAGECSHDTLLTSLTVLLVKLHVTGRTQDITTWYLLKRRKGPSARQNTAASEKIQPSTLARKKTKHKTQTKNPTKTKTNQPNPTKNPKPKN